MLFQLIREREGASFTPLKKRPASKLAIKEKDLENWMANNENLLFEGEEVLVFAQSVQGRSMGDILALDSEGHLVIVEIKRDWSDRTTVGQLLEYAAGMSEHTYDILEKLHQTYWKKYKHGEDYKELISRFRDLIDDQEARKDDIPKPTKGHRVCIVAPESDDGLRRIIEWLREYGVPISFIPFSLYSDSDDPPSQILLEIEQLPKVQQPVGDITHEWNGDWFFNTNETYGRDAYVNMFEQGVIAIYGYPNGPNNLEGTKRGQRVFAYVNERGILACGRIVDGKVVAGDSVFGKDNEFHLRVDWETIVPNDKGVTNRQVRQKFNRWLPVRNVFCGFYGPVPEWVSKKLRKRSPR